MPSSESVLAWATVVANQWQAVAMAWHAALAALLVAIFIGWHPSTRALGYLLVMPLVSVSAVAWASGNPFNGVMFALLSMSLARAAHGMSVKPATFSSPPLLGPGALLVVFGWMYPHFLRTSHWMAYAYASPFGLLPCPTLTVAMGLTLVLGLHRAHPWSVALIIGGAIYGVIGVFRLGVALDYALLGGAATLATAIVVGDAVVKYNGGPPAPARMAGARRDAAARTGSGAVTPGGSR